ncbi:MAG: EcsC family protein [Iodobacter sp.]
MPDNLKEKMTQKVTDALEGVFETVFVERQAYYKKPEISSPGLSSIDQLISNYAMMNAGISGTAAIIPGPLGMLSVVPEIIAVTRNQIAMIYDMGAAYGQEKSINKELLMAIFAAAAGSGTIGVLTIRGSQVLIRRASLQVMQKLIGALGGKISQQALKAALAKWIPLVGAAGMAYWSKYSTEQIAKQAHTIFKLKIVHAEETEN